MYESVLIFLNVFQISRNNLLKFNEVLAEFCRDSPNFVSEVPEFCRKSEVQKMRMTEFDEIDRNLTNLDGWLLSWLMSWLMSLKRPA